MVKNNGLWFASCCQKRHTVALLVIEKHLAHLSIHLQYQKGIFKSL